MPSIGAVSRRLCVAADARGYSRGNDTHQLATQRYLLEVLDSSATAAGLDRVGWERQPGGDSELAILPAGESEALVVDRFLRELDAALARHNSLMADGAKLRLRVAIHFGRLVTGHNGYAGPAPVEVSRLLDSRQLRDALEEFPDVQMAALLSAPVFEDTVKPRHTTLRPEEFRQVAVEKKEYQGTAWLWVPGASQLSSAAGTEPGQSPTVSGGTQVHTTVNGGVTATDIVFGVRNG
ncbi:hypothetical protein [Amycolatopsis sp. NPDC059657]|uniref:hypothetical protein n=1 Tax=Amycolatopsis sp. NPDC059657 TaxID=3346899 RepID=UPI00366E8EEF